MRALYSILLTLAALDPVFAGQRFQLEREYEIQNSSRDQAFPITVRLPGLASYYNSKVLTAAYDPQPTAVNAKGERGEQLEYQFELAPGQKIPLRMVWTVELEPGEETMAKPVLLSDADRALYTSAEKLIESDNVLIVSLANEIRQTAAADRQFIKAAYARVKAQMKYVKFGSDNKGALYALQNKKGDCTEYAALIVALNRAAGIPARINTVMSMRKDGKALYDNHNNAEVYLDGKWLPVEPMFGVKEIGRLTDDEIILRLGWPSASLPWASWSVSKKFDKYKNVKLKGHRWQKLN